LHIEELGEKIGARKHEQPFVGPHHPSEKKGQEAPSKQTQKLG